MDRNPGNNRPTQYSMPAALKKRQVRERAAQAKEGTSSNKTSPQSPLELLLSPGETGIRPFRIGLERMGVPPETSCSKLKWCISSYGPPKANFWNDAQDPSLDLTDKFCVMRVESPNRFWIQNQKQSQDLEILEAAMTNWYNHYWETGTKEDHMQHKDVMEGGFYAGFLENYGWVRVRVMQYIHGPEPKEYIVLVLDHGYQRILPLDSLYYLRQPYLRLPAQAAQMEAYYEGENHNFSQADIATFDADIGGKVIDVIPFSSRHEPDNVFPIVRGVIMTRAIESEKEKLHLSDFYSLNGRIDVTLLLQDLCKFQAQDQD